MIGGAALVLAHPFFFTVPMLVYHFVQKRFAKSSIFLFPFLFLSFEHLHSISEVAFPWLSLGYSQSYNLPDIQFAAFTGLFGLSLQILLINALLCYALTSWINGRKENGYRTAISLLSSFLLIVIPEIYGSIVLKRAATSGYLTAKHNGSPEHLKNLSLKDSILKVSIIQPNIDPNEKWNGNQSEIMDIYKGETAALAADSSDLVVWPETAIPYYILLPQFSSYRNSLENFLGRTNTTLLTGVPLAYYYSDSDSAEPSSHYDDVANKYYDAYNGAALFEPHSKYPQTYGKIVLVPFGERIPYADAVPFLIKPLNWGVGISNWARGRDTTVFKLQNGVRFSTVICYESVFPDYVRQFVNKGADFLVIITNDGWYGKSSGPYQHAAYAVFRAVENRRAIVRAANTGISEFIDPFGRLIGNQTKLDERTTLTEDIPISQSKTYYSIHGDWIAHIAEFISACVVLFGLFLKFRSREWRDYAHG